MVLSAETSIFLLHPAAAVLRLLCCGRGLNRLGGSGGPRCSLALLRVRLLHHCWSRGRMVLVTDGSRHRVGFSATSGMPGCMSELWFCALILPVCFQEKVQKCFFFLFQKTFFFFNFRCCFEFSCALAAPPPCAMILDFCQHCPPKKFPYPQSFSPPESFSFITQKFFVSPQKCFSRKKAAAP